MAPRPFDTWPGYIKNSFLSHKDTPITWPVVMEDCIRNGIKDTNLITNVIFYLHVWDDHGWGPAAGHPELESLWKYFNGIVKKRLKMQATDIDPKPVLVDRKKWRIRYLKDVNCAKLGKDKDHSQRLSSLRSLILLGLEDKNPRNNFDYENYEWSRILSISWTSPSKDMFNVQNIRRRSRTNALDWFNTIADRAEVEGAVMGNALESIESNLYWNTQIFVSWLITGPDTASVHRDSSPEKDNIVIWMERIIALGRNPYHVYSIYHKELSDALRNSRKHPGTWE
jgi:hypothetical protein